jgi:hypothetical protein
MLLPLASSSKEDQRTRVAPALLDAPPILRLWHLASFDAPSVAVVWALSFAWAAGVRLPGWAPILIAVVTWSVYVADRLLDARSALRAGDDGGLHDRHFFHWRHRRILAPLSAAAACLAAILILLQMPLAARERNSVLAAAALVYFSGVHGVEWLPRWIRRIGSKELAVGVLFTAGCAMPTVSRMHQTPMFLARFLVVLGLYAALAWLNCTAIDCWESGRLGAVQLVGWALGVIGVLLAASLWAGEPRVALLALSGAASASLIALLDRWRDRLSPLALRCGVDLVLLTPLVCLAR